ASRNVFRLGWTTQSPQIVTTTVPNPSIPEVVDLVPVEGHIAVTTLISADSTSIEWFAIDGKTIKDGVLPMGLWTTYSTGTRLIARSIDHDRPRYTAFYYVDLKTEDVTLAFEEDVSDDVNRLVPFYYLASPGS